MTEPKKYVLVCKKPKKYLAWFLASLGIPFCVFAMVMVVDFFQSDITVTDGATLRTDMPATLTVPAGGAYNYSYNVTNNGNVPQNFSLALDVYPWEQNLVKVVIDDSSGLEGHTVKNLSIPAGSSVSGIAKFQFNASAQGVFKLNLSLVPNNFTWVI